MNTIAYFITYHGFGHASRAAAVMAAVNQIMPDIRFELFTTCPEWIFKQSLPQEFGYHSVQTDVGMVQKSPLEEDLPATCQRLDQWLPFDDDVVDDLARRLSALKCQVVVCDISALGIAAAKKAALPAILVESFTWDWIYQAYADKLPELAVPARWLKAIYDLADLRIQTPPLCLPVPGALTVGPVYRWPRSDRATVRRRLGIPMDEKMVLISMGGVPDRFEYLDHLPRNLNPWLVFPGADSRLSAFSKQSVHPRIKLLPAHSDYFHPDLINAADVLIGKAGYSTIAEAGHSGLPFGYIPRPAFPETIHLVNYVRDHFSGLPIAPDVYRSGRWVEALPRLLAMAPRESPTENGAFQIARILQEQFGN